MSDAPGNAVTGTFAGLAQGSTFTSGGRTFQISYTGGLSGQDVVLTDVTPPSVAPPTISKSFDAATIPLGGQTSLSFTITNPNASTSLTGVGFTDTLPAGLVVATPSNGSSGSCGGGTITAVAGSNSVSLIGAALSASGSCTFSVNAMGVASGPMLNTTKLWEVVTVRELPGMLPDLETSGP